MAAHKTKTKKSPDKFANKLLLFQCRFTGSNMSKMAFNKAKQNIEKKKSEANQWKHILFSINIVSEPSFLIDYIIVFSSRNF